MTITFYKYQGTGNDFIIIDNRQLLVSKNDTKVVKRLCDRRFGIGADGLILLEPSSKADFKMVYFNADGNESSMCGNGGRCIVAFAKSLGIIDSETTFDAIDGLHYASIDGEVVKLQMQDVASLKFHEDYVFLDTGSPHHVQFERNLDDLEIKKEGSAIRYGVYGEAGSNVNFVNKKSNDTFRLRTYERGVEDETLSCGTGATAVAIAMHALNQTDLNEVNLIVEGGMLKVSFNETEGNYENVFLIGLAQQVFKGEVTW